MSDVKRTPNGPLDIIGLEVWTGDVFKRHGDNIVTQPTEYFTTKMPGIEEIGSDGYAGGSYWIRYDNGEIHAYPENAVRRVIRGQR